MHVILLLITFWLSAAAASESRVWDCQITADLKGEGRHFLIYGRDSWNGEGSLYCESGAQNTYRPIVVSFNSMYDGFGADQYSHLQLLIDLTTKMHPAELQIRTLVRDRDESIRVKWQFSSQLIEGRVFVTNSTPAAATRSLQRGTLFIRSSGD